MQSKILSFLFSTKLMAFLFISFAAAMAAGTFIEDAHNTDTARIWVYNAWWFELIMLMFVVNFTGNIFRFRLYKKEKWATLILHLSFLFILIGAFVTRYISYEGMMPIREGDSSNIVFSEKVYLTAFIDGNYKGELKRKIIEKPLILSPVAKQNLNFKDNFDQKNVEITIKDYLVNVSNSFEPDDKGEDLFKIVTTLNGGRSEHFLKNGELKNINNILFSLNNFVKGAVNITQKEGEYYINAPFDGTYMTMATQATGTTVKDVESKLILRSLYNFANAQFVFPEPITKGKMVLKSDFNIKNKQGPDAIIVEVKTPDGVKNIELTGSKGTQGMPQIFKIGDLEFTLSFGSKIYTLPFQIKLNDFIAEKYPGTEKNYASFESKVTLIDENKKTNHRIFMNNILDYKGYRFFQANFDPDEKGTILSVNHDYWGTMITYIGYFLLYFGMMMILFVKNTRFDDLRKKLAQVKQKKISNLFVLAIFLFIFNGFNAQHHHHDSPVNEITKPDNIEQLIKDRMVGKEHAAKFGRLIIQDENGRMKPLNTFSSELLRKVSKSDNYKGFNSDQVLLSMITYPREWTEIPLIYIKKGNDSIRNILGVGSDVKYLKFIDFFDANGSYKLSPYLEEASKAQVPSVFQKDFKLTDQKVSLLSKALTKSILKIFPIPNDKNNKWINHAELQINTNKELDNIKLIMPVYEQTLKEAFISKDYKQPNDILNGMHLFQKKFGSKVMPLEDKIEAEILYNKYDIFKNIYLWYMMIGVFMLIFSVIQTVYFQKKWLKTTLSTFQIIIYVLFGLHTLGLIARWYVSGHAPWSNAYESMIYVAWATMFFGIAFDRKSYLTISSAAFVTSMILMIAHWNWMDPEIGNLVPVLNSYWLMIHVAVIVASYGPFALGMILGLVSLIMMIITNKNNKEKMKLNIQEITYINEMALTVGLVMLTIGNFLGGQWANESWGRYWGWDPKETWALISIMVYAFVIHARFVPFLRGLFAYNFMSVLAFASILMTYFGVNFHLSGLHSYASGEKQNVIYYGYALFIVLVIATFAYFKYKKHYKK
ncbi:MAG: cytochrome c biogenesis protein CcsA [Flavobacterium sp.]